MTNTRSPHYISPKLEVRPCPEKGGYGVFAREAIVKHDLLCAWGGDVVAQSELGNLSHEIITHGIQVEEGIYLMPPTDGLTSADYFNHSCAPNAGLSGQICLVAIRDISPDEEVCFDYAMSDTTPYDEFDCHCGAVTCRGRVTGNDWRRPELQRRYYGYFMPYIQRRIDALYSKRKSSNKMAGRKNDYDIKIVSGKKTVYGIKIVSGKKGNFGRRPLVIP